MPWSTRTTLILALAGLPFQLYAAGRAVSALASLTSWPRRRLRIATAAVVIYFAVYPLSSLAAYSFGFSTAFQGSPFFDRAFVYPFWIGLVLGVQLGILLLAIDLIRLALLAVPRDRKARWKTVEAWFITACVCLVTLYVSARVYSDTFRLRTQSRDFRLAGLPPELDGLRIAHIADIQVDNRTNGRKIQAFIDTVNALNADLILFSGDTVTSGRDFISQAADAMGKLKGRLGTYAVLGDHDYFADSRQVVSELQARDITVLENASTSVSVEGGSLGITGVTNVYRNRLDEGLVERLAADRPSASVNILLTHQPSEWLVAFAAERRYELFLAGHTHGGQIAFPLPGFLLTGSSFETEYVTGFYEVGSMLVSTNNGLGLTLAPIRYHAPAEVTLIVLKR
jgi:predicted MPP superfamily phosphohydrolase